MSYEWRNRFFWPSFLAFSSGFDFARAMHKYPVVHSILGVILLCLCLHRVYENQKDWKS